MHASDKILPQANFGFTRLKVIQPVVGSCQLRGGVSLPTQRRAHDVARDLESGLRACEPIQTRSI